MEEEEVSNQKTRDFVCACGKNYLSYAALFTHIKQKHDGKAPGPIVRPRSQRKRGRPRKNPLNDQDVLNSDSDAVKNGISFNNEINNNINNIYQKKAKKAAQLLGCGQFQAFQAYKPQLGLNGKGKSQKQDNKKLTLKRYSSNTEKSQPNMQKDDSPISNEAPKNLKFNKSAPPTSKDMKNDRNSYYYNFVIQHIKNLFKDYQPSEDQYSCHQIMQIFDCITQQISQPYKQLRDTPVKRLTIENGFQFFLQQIQDYLQQFQCKQVSFLLSLFYEYISKQVGRPSNLMHLGIQISEFAKYISSFLADYLPAKINQLFVGCLFIFKDLNPANLFMCLCNWIAINQMPQAIAPPNISLIENNTTSKNNKKQNKNIRKQIVQEIRKQQKQQKTEKLQKSQSQDDVKFQQINYVLEKARLARQKILKEQQDNQNRKGKKHRKLANQGLRINGQQQMDQNISQQNSQQSQQQVDYHQESLEHEGSDSQQQCIDQENQANSGKIITSQQ